MRSIVKGLILNPTCAVVRVHRKVQALDTFRQATEECKKSKWVEDPPTGGNDGEVPPVPIPNTVVKLSSAESTWLDTAREDRSLPVPS